MKRVTYREDHNHFEVTLLIPDEVAEAFYLPLSVDMMSKRTSNHEWHFLPTKVEDI